MKSKVNKLDDKEFIRLVNISNNSQELFHYIGYKGKVSGRSLVSINNRMKELSIYTQFKEKSSIYNSRNRQKQNINDILVENSGYSNMSRLKKRIIENNIIKYECDVCGNKGSWMGIPMTLQLDHINGINNDHRKTNLRFLCPNCHSQTDTYTGRNIDKKKKKYLCIDCGKEISNGATRCRSCAGLLQKSRRPSIDVLNAVLMDNNYNLSKVGRLYGVSDNTIRKWCKFYRLETKHK